MTDSTGQSDSSRDLRRHPRLRLSVPCACAFSRRGLARWSALEKTGCGVVFDVSAKGAKVMSPLAVSPGDELAVSLRLPHQPVAMNVDATVRWRNEYVFGLEFVMVSRVAEMRLQKFLARPETVLSVQP